jgi:hypothetical protein
MRACSRRSSRAADAVCTSKAIKIYDVYIHIHIHVYSREMRCKAARTSAVLFLKVQILTRFASTKAQILTQKGAAGAAGQC